MYRRSLCFALLLSPLMARSQVGAVAKIAILTDLVKAVGAAGESISKITAGFKDLVIAGKDSYTYVAAARERDRLINLSRRTTNLIVSQNMQVVASLDNYLALASATQADWEQVALHLEATLGAVRELLVDVQAEDGSFVLEPAFLTLNQTLSSRALVLTRLSTMPAPSSPEELALLQQASAHYKLLIANAREAVSQLNDYIKNSK